MSAIGKPVPGMSNTYTPMQISWPVNRRAIAMLIKGEAEGDEANYELPTRPIHYRLQSVARLPWAKTYDHLIFHESSLPEKHKPLLQQWSPQIPLRFINVQAVFDAGKLLQSNWKRDAENGRYSFRDPALNRGVSCWDEHNIDNKTNTTLELDFFGYKSMCQFWFADFLDYVTDYDAVLRIDDDIVIEPTALRDPDPGPGTMINAPRKMGADKPGVVVGVAGYFKQLSANMSRTKPIERHAIWTGREVGWPSPYSCLVWFNTTWAREWKWAADAVKETQCIYHNRWGDHILWGAVLKLAGVHFRWVKEMRLPYCHGSHSRGAGCSLAGCRGKRGEGCR